MFTPVDVVIVDDDIVDVDDIADVNAHAKGDAVVVRHVGGTIGRGYLNLDGTAHSIHYTWELQQSPSPGDAASVGGNRWIDYFLSKDFQRCQLVAPRRE